MNAKWDEVKRLCSEFGRAAHMPSLGQTILNYCEEHQQSIQDETRVDRSGNRVLFGHHEKTLLLTALRPLSFKMKKEYVPALKEVMKTLGYSMYGEKTQRIRQCVENYLKANKKKQSKGRTHKAHDATRRKQRRMEVLTNENIPVNKVASPQKDRTHYEGEWLIGDLPLCDCDSDNANMSFSILKDGSTLMESQESVTEMTAITTAQPFDDDEYETIQRQQERFTGDYPIPSDFSYPLMETGSKSLECNGAGLA